MSQGFQYNIIFTNQLLIYSKSISNIINIIERKVHKFNTLHLKCFPGFMQQLENLVFVEFPRFLYFSVLVFFHSDLSFMHMKSRIFCLPKSLPHWNGKKKKKMQELHSYTLTFVSFIYLFQSVNGVMGTWPRDYTTFRAQLS